MLHPLESGELHTMPYCALNTVLPVSPIVIREPRDYEKQEAVVISVSENYNRVAEQVCFRGFILKKAGVNY